VGNDVDSNKRDGSLKAQVVRKRIAIDRATGSKNSSARCQCRRNVFFGKVGHTEYY